MKDNLERLLAEYLDEETAGGRTVQGLIGLRTRVPWLFAYMRENDLLPAELGIRGAMGYQGWLSEKKTKKGKTYSSYTVNGCIVAATSFYDFLKEKGLVSTNPFKEIRKVRVPRKLPRNIPREKATSLLLEKLSRYEEGENLKQRITGYKVHVVAELMYATGMRISEVAGLKVKDIDFRRSLVNVREGKGRRSRVALLNEYAREVLRLYVDKMREVIFTEWNERNPGSLFGVQWGWFGKVVNKRLQQAAAAVGMEGFTSHMFRHTLGFHLLRAGCNIRHIQSILGHKLLRNTEIYTRVDKEDLRAVLDKFHPRRWKRTKNGQTNS